MTNRQTEKELFSIIQSINQACVQGSDFDELADHFADDFTTYAPGFSQCAKGKKANLRMYSDFCSKANIQKMEVSDEHIDIFEDTAVINYRYDSRWEFDGTGFDEDGREILVFKHISGRWQAIWRTLIIGNRQVNITADKKTDHTAGADNIRTQCLTLMENSPACELTTIDADGFPHTTCMNNLRDKNLYPDLVDLFENPDNDFVVYMSTHNQSNKMARMLTNQKVSVYFCDAPRFHGLMLGGKIEIITDQKLKHKIWQKGWTMYYPNGPEGPEYGIIKLTPTVAKGWSCTGEFKLNPSEA